MNSLGKTYSHRPVPPRENNSSNDISLDEQSQIDRIADKVDFIIKVLGAAVEKKDVETFEWVGDGFKPYES